MVVIRFYQFYDSTNFVVVVAIFELCTDTKR